MERNTHSNPGCYHSMINYLSELSGISTHKEIRIDDPQKLRSKPKVGYSGKKKSGRLLYSSYNIKVVDKDGNVHPYHNQEKSQRYDQAGIIADHFLVTVRRNIEEFGIKVNPAGKYKDSLGGGWYQMVTMWQVNDQFFADMDCSC